MEDGGNKGKNQGKLGREVGERCGLIIIKKRDRQKKEARRAGGKS